MSMGIPQLLVPPISSIGRSILTLAQGALWDYLTTETKWGIYYAGSMQEIILGVSKPSSISGVLSQGTSLSGAKALLNGKLFANQVFIDSVVSINSKKGSEISKYRIETGSFSSFNKVEKPRLIQIRLTKGGTEEERFMFIKWLDMVAKGFNSTITRGNPNNLFDIYVPEAHYTNMTMTDCSISRNSRDGVSLIIADCSFEEVMQVTMQYTDSKTDNSKNAQDKAAKNNSVQANSPSPNALSKLNGLVKL